METEQSSRLSSVQEHAGWPASLHRFRWLGKLLGFAQAKQGGEAVSEPGGLEPQDGIDSTEEKSDLFGVPIGREAVEQAFWELAGEAMEEQRRRNAIDDPNQVYPPALRLGPQMTQDPRIWAADPRIFLPEGHPRRPAKLNSRSDPEYLRAIESMLIHGIPGRDGR